MERKLRTCAVCGTQYKFCNHCREDKNKPLWYFTFHSENCKDIYNITSDFENGEIDAKEAKEKLNKLNLSNLDNFGESYKKSINKINETSTSTTAATKTEKKIETQQTIQKDVKEEKVFAKPKNKIGKIDVEE